MISVRAVKPQGGRRADLGGQYFRSKWEANYARYLRFLQRNRQIFTWSYELHEFRFEGVRRGPCSFYKPDFHVVNNDGSDEFHEVKGWMDRTSQVKLERMAKYYPQIKIIVIDRDCYQDIARKLGRVIEGWEG